MSTPQRQERVTTAYDALGTLRDEMDTLRRERDAARREIEALKQDLKEAQSEVAEAQRQSSEDAKALQLAHEERAKELKARSSLHQANEKLRRKWQEEQSSHAKTREQLNTKTVRGTTYVLSSSASSLVVLEKRDHDRLRALLWHYMQQYDARSCYEPMGWTDTCTTVVTKTTIPEPMSNDRNSVHAPTRNAASGEGTVPETSLPVMSATVLANDDSATAPLLAKLLDTPFEDGTPVVRNLNWVQACKDCVRRDIADRCTHIVRPPQHVGCEATQSTDTTTKTVTQRLIDGGFKICAGCNCWAKVSRGIDAYTHFFCDFGCREKWLNQTPGVSGQ
jgi:hypothetical protein